MSAPYKILVIDPPWPKRKGGLRASRPNQTRALDYSTMGLPEIENLLREQILPLADTPHNVFLWTIEQFLVSAEEMLHNLGYAIHCRMIWDKGNGVAPAFTIRYCHEYLLWAYRPGQMLKVSPDAQGKYSSVFRGAQREHSRKPDEAYKLLDTLFGPVSKIDVFSRESREGWDSWGDQKGFFDASPST